MGKSIIIYSIAVILTFFVNAEAIAQQSLKIAEAQSLKIAGTGDSQTLLRLIGKAFEEKYPNIQLEIPNSIGSGGGIKALIRGKTDLARTARPLKKKEQQGLVEWQFAKSPIAFVAHSSVKGISNITTRQILQVYSGKLKNWNQLGGPNNKIFPIDRETDDSSRKILNENLQGFKTTRSVGKVYYSAPKALQAIMTHKYTIGFLPYSSVKSKNFAIFSVNGTPVTSQSYPYTSTLSIVSRGIPTGVLKQFIDFLYSVDAQQIMVHAGVIPIKN